MIVQPAISSPGLDKGAVNDVALLTLVVHAPAFARRSIIPPSSRTCKRPRGSARRNSTHPAKRAGALLRRTRHRPHRQPCGPRPPAVQQRRCRPRRSPRAAHRAFSFMGRPARGIENRLMRELGALSDLPPEFPLASGALGPLRAMAEVLGPGGFLIVLGRRARCRNHGGIRDKADATIGRRRAGRRVASANRTAGRTQRTSTRQAMNGRPEHEPSQWPPSLR